MCQYDGKFSTYDSVGSGENVMKVIFNFLCVGVAAAILSSGCTTYTSESELGMQLDRNDSYMFWICAYFKEANGRWPTNTPDLIDFLQKDYTNMVQEIERNYRSTKYMVSPEGWLILETHHGRGQDKKLIRSKEWWSQQCAPPLPRDQQTGHSEGER